MIEITEKEFTQLTTYVLTNYGIDLSKKKVLIQGRLTPHLNKRGVANFTEYLAQVKNDKTGVELQMMLNRLTTNLTYFMRENEHFEFMASTVLPELEKTQGTRPLRVWSAGCSSGEEPYTLAMVLSEHFKGRPNKFVILASDISQQVLVQAERGIYSADKLKDVPPAWVTKYFDKLTDEDYQVKAEIRKLISFRTANLMDMLKFSNPFDLLFCRNVMIYFEKQRKVELIGRFYNWTAPGGYFFISHSENIGRESVGFKMVRPSVFKKY